MLGRFSVKLFYESCTVNNFKEFDNECGSVLDFREVSKNVFHAECHAEAQPS